MRTDSVIGLVVALVLVLVVMVLVYMLGSYIHPIVGVLFALLVLLAAFSSRARF